MMRGALGVLLFAPIAFAAPVPKELKTDDASRLVGTWQTISAEYNGREYNKDYLVFTRETVNWKSRADGPDVLWTLKLDPAKSPKEFEIALQGNNRYLGIYKLEGNRLTIACKINEAPSGFNSDNATYLHILVRAEPVK